VKTKLALLITCLTTAALVTFGQSNSGPVTNQFQISSLQTPFGVQGEFRGTYVIDDDSIKIYVTDSKLYVSEHCPYQGRRLINYLTFSLATSTSPDCGWKIESEAEPIAIGIVMVPREEQTLGQMYFVIPRDKSTDIRKRWLVVKMQTDALDDVNEKPGHGFVFASSSRDVFTPITHFLF
jgi:hypothetical protein